MQTTQKRHQLVTWRRAKRGAAAAAAFVLTSTLAAAGVAGASNAGPSSNYIVEGASTSSVVALGGQIGISLPVIKGFVATLSTSAAAELTATGASVTADETVAPRDWGWSASDQHDHDVVTSSSTSTTHAPSAVYPEVTGANVDWSHGINGAGIGVAVLDTGIDAALPDLAGRVTAGVDLTGGNSPYTDQYGHGTFVAGLIASSGVSSSGKYVGEAPDANLISIKVAGATGVTTEGQVIEGIGWAVANESTDNIRVLNLSIGIKPPGPSATDPLDQAVEQAWNSGIVVVTSAGNYGPDYGTISEPGNDPLVITVGAMDDDAGTNPANYTIPSFSSAGPTLYDGWFKPDLVDPGRSVVSLADPGSTVYEANPSALVGATGFVGSGDIFSSAIVSGIVALTLQAHPNFTPNTVKGRLIATALPGPVGNPFVDGHGIGEAIGPVTALNVPTLNQSAAEAAEQNSPGNSVSLVSTWQASSWNPANWSGAAWNGAAWSGAAWNGAAWNGAAWNGAAWNGAAWNGAAWNDAAWSLEGFAGAAWNGAAWNGAAWNGAAWNGAAWNGAAWNGAAWNGAAWNGAAWNGAAWNGAAWNGAAWNGAAWNGAAWNGAAWNGAAWNGAAWNGAAWNGAAWNGAAWNGAAWNGAAWNGAAWNGAAWNAYAYN